MLVQSGGGKVYAVLANNAAFELGLMPQLQIMSTTVFLAVRCRFKSLTTDYFDPMLAPKQVLVGGIERSENTLRGTVMLNTGFTLEKVGAGFADIVSQKLFTAADGFLLGLVGAADVSLTVLDKRDDFTKDFAQLVTSAIAPIFPPKDFSEADVLINAFDLMLFGQTAQAPKSPFAALPGGKAVPMDQGASVFKVAPLGGDDEPPAPASADVTVDKPATGADTGAKVHILGSVTPRPTTEEIPVADPTY